MTNSNSESDILLFQKSPYGNIDAVVESDGRTVYLYLQGDEAFGMRACWVRNLIRGPLDFNRDELQAGLAPILPRIHTVNPEPQNKPTPEDLELVWFAEGNGAALLERGEILAVIPPWSGMDGFHGYAAECQSENSVCWPMPSNAALGKRIELAREFWNSWSNGQIFKDHQPKIICALEQRFGLHQKYFSIDGGSFPLRGLARFHVGSRIILSTVGMSLCPQPIVEMHSDDPVTKRRVELAISLPAETESVWESAAQQLSGLAAMPWRQWTFLDAGHTCAWNDPTMGEVKAGICMDVEQVDWELPSISDEPVRLLWIVPLGQPAWNSVQAGQRRVADYLELK
ncbi:MAG: suppressor of fused domain protein [Pirellulaceae bacterium]